jgi:hypothetical protein
VFFWHSDRKGITREGVGVGATTVGKCCCFTGFYGPRGFSAIIVSIVDEDMTPSDTTIDYKVRSFLYLHSNFVYNSLDSICTCHYLNVGTNVSQSASPSKLNFRFAGSPIVLH